MNPMYFSVAVVSCYNDNDAFVPEIWAHTGLAILEENMVAAKLVHRDFENAVANYGDVVNTRRPGDFKVKRKRDGGSLSRQDANATPVQVPLNQWFTEHFVIYDGESSKSFQDLVDVYLLPAMQAIARGVDRAVLGRIHSFLNVPTKRVGRLSNLNDTNAKNYILDARQILNENKAHANDRNLVLAPMSETALLKCSEFTKANERGDNGTALEQARLGRILGFNTYMDQNVNGLVSGADTDTTLTVTAALAAQGSGSQVTAGIVGAVTTGEFLVVAGNDQPTYITAHTEDTGATVAVTLNEANKNATVAVATSTRYKKCAVNGGYIAGWSEDITVDGYTSGKAPQIGQLISFGTGNSRRTYTIIEATDAGSTCAILLDRPLEVLLTNDDAAFPGPYGAFNWAFHREALALVTRPLALPRKTSGVDAAVLAYNDIAMRIVAQYDLDVGGTKVNLEILGGTAVLDERLAVVFLG